MSSSTSSPYFALNIAFECSLPGKRRSIFGSSASVKAWLTAGAAPSESRSAQTKSLRPRIRLASPSEIARTGALMATTDSGETAAEATRAASPPMEAPTSATSRATSKASQARPRRGLGLASGAGSPEHQAARGQHRQEHRDGDRRREIETEGHVRRVLREPECVAIDRACRDDDEDHEREHEYDRREEPRRNLWQLRATRQAQQQTCEQQRAAGRQVDRAEQLQQPGKGRAVAGGTQVLERDGEVEGAGDRQPQGDEAGQCQQLRKGVLHMHHARRKRQSGAMRDRY